MRNGWLPTIGSGTYSSLNFLHEHAWILIGREDNRSEEIPSFYLYLITFKKAYKDNAPVKTHSLEMVK